MTHETGLRDRIAEVLERIGNAWDAQMMASIVDDKSPPTQKMADTQAQAIIDEFGLTIETHATDQSRNPHARIISEWKRT